LKPTHFAIFAAIALSGCVGDYTISDEKLPTASTSDLCKSLTFERVNGTPEDATRIFKEIERRKVFSSRELSAISKEQALPGMSEEAGLCAWGYYWYDLNTTTTASGTSKQYVFGDGTYMPRKYLYATNGQVTGTQE
jgi:hypothetical protein